MSIKLSIKKTYNEKIVQNYVFFTNEDFKIDALDKSVVSKFSNQIKVLSISLILVGLLGILYGFYTAPSTVEEAKEIIASMSHDSDLTMEVLFTEIQIMEILTMQILVMESQITEILNMDTNRVVMNMIMTNMSLISYITSHGQQFMYPHYSS